MDERQAPTTSAAPQPSSLSETAQDFIQNQLQLEAEAREVLPYQFDTCTKPLGPLRQLVFSCLTCNPPPKDEPSSKAFQAAGVCYACSISCHGEHELVELFTRRNFVCDCGTRRLPLTSPCTLRANPMTGAKGAVHSEEPAAINKYNQNFENRFCGCRELYDPEKQRGTMFQCLGLGTVDDGGCGEDWWHPECLMGLPHDERRATSVSNEGKDCENNFEPDKKPQSGFNAIDTPVDAQEVDESPPGFPREDEFDHFVCYKCIAAFPWIGDYAGSQGFLPGVAHNRDRLPHHSPGEHTPRKQVSSAESSLRKRKAEENLANDENSKKSKPISDAIRSNGESGLQQSPPRSKCVRPVPPVSQASPAFSLFLKEDFRDHVCRCPSCFSDLSRHPQLLEEETAYSPPLSESSSVVGEGRANRPASVGGSSRSLMDLGEAALSNMDRVRAIEGVMAYNHLRDNLKGFLKPFAESGTPVSAEDIKAHFEKLRGDSEAIRAARTRNEHEHDGGDGTDRQEQSGY